MNAAVGDRSLTKATRTPIISERVHSVLSTLNREVWNYTLRGLYEQHQFLFTLLMAIKIDVHAGNITHAEFMKFIKGGASLDLNTAPPKPYKWILDASWLNLVELSSLPTFADILTQGSLQRFIYVDPVPLQFTEAQLHVDELLQTVEQFRVAHSNWDHILKPNNGPINPNYSNYPDCGTNYCVLIAGIFMVYLFSTLPPS